jgi:two-component sensor histidine kinase
VVTLFLGLKDYTTAVQYIHKMEVIAVNERSLSVKKVVQKHLFTMDSLQGNYVSAIRHYQQYMAYSDAMAIVKHDRQLAQLKVQYETEQKDRDLDLKEKHISLLTLETGRQKEQLRHETTVRSFSYAIGTLLLLLLLISVWAYNIKRRANLQLKEQQFEINQRNITLKQLLDERDWLLKEVHHRVKNNLQIVISLLNSQSLHLNNETAKQALRESKNRIEAISIIHQKLYRSDSFSGVNMNYYVTELLDFLQDSFSIRDLVEVETDLDCSDLDVSQAVPIGLIINEAVTNAIKYAVPHTAQPRIHIKLHCDEAHVALSITDNGPGFPPDFDPQASGSFGLNLIIGLVRQLRGKVSFNNATGVGIAVSLEQSRILV